MLMRVVVGILIAVPLVDGVGAGPAEGILLPRVSPLRGPSKPTEAVSPALMLYPGSGGSAVDDEDRWESPELVVYDAGECDDFNANECALVTIDCADPWGRGLTVRIHGFENEELSGWLLEEREFSLKMTGGLIPEGRPRAAGMTLNDMYGLWSVDFVAPYSSDPGLTISDPDTPMTFRTINRAVTVQPTDDDIVMLEQFIRGCRQE